MMKNEFNEMNEMNEISFYESILSKTIYSFNCLKYVFKKVEIIANI